MKKIINTLRYGDGKSKFILVLTFFAGVGTVACFAMTFIMNQLMFFFGGVICGFITISLAQTFGIEQQDIPQPKLIENSDIENTLNNVEHHIGGSDEEFSEKKTDKSAKNKEEKIRSRTNKSTDVEGNNLSKEEDINQNHKEVESNAITTETQQEVESDPITTETQQEVELDLITTDNQEEVDTEDDVEDIPKKKRKKKDKTKEKTKEDSNDKESNSDNSKKIFKNSKGEIVDFDTATEEEVLETYTRKVIKKAMHKYKVKKDHRMVIIDSCRKLNIYQAPAYIWVSDKDFNILVIGKEPRHFTLPIYSITEITYLKKQHGDAEMDYPLFKGDSMLANMFRPYLPDYSYSTRSDDLTAYKNLYGIGPGIYFTNNSAASLFDLLAVRFYVEDKITTSNKANYFFKEIYKCNIILRDNVIDANGYADKVSALLDDMAHSTISYNEFRDTLNLLIKNKLITQEFASHFSDIRDKISR